jgi:NitT/TauT family transport system ATP-binding protein
VIGPSGSGKTTLLRLLAGLVAPTRGSVAYRGAEHREPSRDIAIVFQDYVNALLPWRTAAGNVSLALEAARVPPAEREPRIKQLLHKVGLDSSADKFPTEMSGGMQQRLQIARALAQEPGVLLMDEPFGALDAMTRQRLQDELLGIVSDSGVTTFFVTHDLEEAIYLSDRIIALEPDPGRIADIFQVPLPRARPACHPRGARVRAAAPGALQFHKAVRVMPALRGLAIPLGLIALWQALASVYGIESDTLAAPSAVLAALGRGLAASELWAATGDTLAATGLGLALGVGMGLLFGALPPLSRSRC